MGRLNQNPVTCILVCPVILKSDDITLRLVWWEKCPDCMSSNLTCLTETHRHLLMRILFTYIKFSQRTASQTRIYILILRVLHDNCWSLKIVIRFLQIRCILDLVVPNCFWTDLWHSKYQKAAERGGYGGERYEQLEFQKKVGQRYKDLHSANWKVVYCFTVI